MGSPLRPFQITFGALALLALVGLGAFSAIAGTMYAAAFLAVVGTTNAYAAWKYRNTISAKRSGSKRERYLVNKQVVAAKRTRNLIVVCYAFFLAHNALWAVGGESGILACLAVQSLSMLVYLGAHWVGIGARYKDDIACNKLAEAEANSNMEAMHNMSINSMSSAANLIDASGSGETESMYSNPMSPMTPASRSPAPGRSPAGKIGSRTAGIARMDSMAHLNFGSDKSKDRKHRKGASSLRGIATILES